MSCKPSKHRERVNMISPCYIPQSVLLMQSEPSENQYPHKWDPLLIQFSASASLSPYCTMYVSVQVNLFFLSLFLSTFLPLLLHHQWLVLHVAYLRRIKRNSVKLFPILFSSTSRTKKSLGWSFFFFHTLVQSKIASGATHDSNHDNNRRKKRVTYKQLQSHIEYTLIASMSFLFFLLLPFFLIQVSVTAVSQIIRLCECEKEKKEKNCHICSWYWITSWSKGVWSWLFGNNCTHNCVCDRTPMDTIFLTSCYFYSSNQFTDRTSSVKLQYPLQW